MHLEFSAFECNVLKNGRRQLHRANKYANNCSVWYWKKKTVYLSRKIFDGGGATCQQLTLFSAFVFQPSNFHSLCRCPVTYHPWFFRFLDDTFPDLPMYCEHSLSSFNFFHRFHPSIAIYSYSACQDPPKKSTKSDVAHILCATSRCWLVLNRCECPCDIHIRVTLYVIEVNERTRNTHIQRHAHITYKKKERQQQ